MQSRKGMSVGRFPESSTMKKRKREGKGGRKKEEENVAEKVRGEGCISWCTSRHGKFARQVQRQAFHRL